MKKQLLAIAVLGMATGMAAGMAQAQSNVSIYGVADAGIVIDSGSTPTTTRVSGGIASGSRLGFRGKEDLGGGLSASFTIENGFNIDNGTAAQGGLVFGRQAFVGLSGNFGSVTLGRQYSPFYLALRDIADPFEVGLAGSATNLIPGNTRVDNMVVYGSPSYAGFTAQLAYGAGEVAGNSTASRVLGGTLAYAMQDLKLALTHHRKDNAAGNDHARTTMLAAKYTIGTYTLHVAHAANDSLAGARSKDTLLGGQVAFGADRVLVSYMRHDVSGADGRDASQWAFGYLHGLSKRTDLYAAYGRIDNTNGATYTVGTATDAGTGDRAFNLGMRHRF